MRSVSTMILAIAVGGCGATFPEISDFPATPGSSLLLVHAINKTIKCEVVNAVQFVINNDANYARLNKQPLFADWMRDWGAKISVTMTIDEHTAFNPTTVWTPATLLPLLTVSAGVSGRADSKQERTMDHYRTFRSMIGDNTCKEHKIPFGYNGSFLIKSDLRVQEALTTMMSEFITGNITLSTEGTPPNRQTSLTHQVQFKVVTSGNVDPVFMLRRFRDVFTVNSGGPALFTTSRTRTHKLLITFGTAGAGKETHFAAKISNLGNN